MEVVNNTTPATKSEGSGVNLLVGLILVLLLAFLFFYYALPAIQRAGGGTVINMPEQSNPAPSTIEVPKDINIDANINPGDGGDSGGE